MFKSFEVNKRFDKLGERPAGDVSVKDHLRCRSKYDVNLSASRPRTI
jgi:hypothetical protein